jgi:hypothetical protein
MKKNDLGACKPWVVLAFVDKKVGARGGGERPSLLQHKKQKKTQGLKGPGACPHCKESWGLKVVEFSRF